MLHDAVKTPFYFYEELAEIYDDMTHFSSRIETEQIILQNLRKKFKFKTALDTACGTGLHSIVLQKMGVETTGVDISQKMLNRAKKNADRVGINLKWVLSSFQNLTQSLRQTFDIIFCLGNSLPHVSNESQLKDVLRQFYELLNPQGVILLQLLNYHKILQNRERIINITKQGHHEYVRFYDFFTKKIQFNILYINWETKPPSHSLQSTILYPYKKSELQQALEIAGFNHISYLGDMQLSKFSEKKSRNLVVIGSKTA